MPVILHVVIGKQKHIHNHAEVQIGFQQTVYNVNESAGSVNLGVSIISGNVGEFVLRLNASTVDGTATSK